VKFAFLLLAVAGIPSIRLNPQTVKEFEAYMQVADRSMNERALGKVRLPTQGSSGPLIIPWDANDTPRGLTDGLVHDWIAASFIPNAKVPDVVAVLQDYGQYREMYQPDLIQARVLGENGDTRKVRMRTIKHKVITVILDIDYDVEYRKFPNGRVQVWSRSTSIREVENAGKPDESVMPPDVGAGFLWRLNTYWQLEEREGGVYMECRAISLTRGIPAIVSMIVKPMVSALPRESLTNTLTATRAAVEARIRNRGSGLSSAVGLVK
jgi:hypothetical protein